MSLLIPLFCALTWNKCSLECFKHFVLILFQKRMDLFFTTAEVMARTGITARQLQWWDEQGIVRPMREGRRRLYSIDDVAEVTVICDLLQRGFSLQRVRKVMNLLQKEFKKRLVDTVNSHSEYHLLTDGERIFLRTSAEQILDLLEDSRQPMLAICLSDKVREVQSGIRKKSPQKEAAAKGQQRTAKVR